MTAKPTQQALDRLADVLVEDIMSTPAEELLAEVAEDHGNPRALAQAFDKVALRARSSGARLAGEAFPAAAIGATSALPRKPALAARLSGFWQSVLDAVFPSRLSMVAVSSVCVGALAFIVAGPALFYWNEQRVQSDAPPQDRGVDDGGVTRGFGPVPTLASYVVLIASEPSNADAETTLRSLQAKFPKELGKQNTMVRRVDLNVNGNTDSRYRVLAGPFGSANEADRLCSSLKAGGERCTVQKD
jgi:hypothetical protein